MTEREYFLNNVTFLYDSREKDIWDILVCLSELGCKVRRCAAPDHFRQGDWSFEIGDRDYRSKWLVERKGSLGELYSNIMSGNKTGGDLRNNLEEEFVRMAENGVAERLLIVQGCTSLDEMRAYKHPQGGVRGASAGKHIVATLASWECSNRHGFKVVLCKTPLGFVTELVSRAFYFWRNEMITEHKTKDFLKALRR